MLSPYHTTFVSMLLLSLIFSYHTMPVSSSPIVIFQDRNSHAASNSSYIDDQLLFDVSSTFALLVALSITCIWITFRVTVDSFISWVNGALVVSIAVAEQVVDILSYFSLDTILGIATSIAVDANDLIGEFTRPTAGPANPISTTARSAPRSQRPRVVIPAGYGVRRISTSDTAGAPPLRPTSPSPMVVHP